MLLPLQGISDGDGKRTAGKMAALQNGYAGRRAMSFLTAAWAGINVAILRIMARTRRLSPSESVVLYFLISARKRISSWDISPRAFWVSRSRGVSVPGQKAARELA